MNKKINLTILSILSLLIIISSSNIVMASYENESFNLIDSYYTFFEKFDLNEYLLVQDLRAYSKEELEIKKNNINLMWKNVEPKSHHIYNLDVEYRDNIKLVTYDLDAEVSDYNNHDFKYKMEMAAILTNINNSWKILKIMPLNQLDELIELINTEKSLEILNKSLNEQFINKTVQNLSIDINSSISLMNINKTEKNNCKFDLKLLNYINKINIKEFVSSKIYDLLIGNFGVNLIISNANENNKFIIEVDNGKIKLVNSTIKPIKYSIFVDTCTLLAIQDKTISPMKAYNQDLILIKGESVGSKFKLFFGKTIFKIFNFFKSWFKTKSIILEGENFKFVRQGKYDYIGPSFRGDGELYLGTGKSSAKIKFNSDKEKKVFVYIKINDDKKHKDDSRSVEIYFNKGLSKFDSIIKYNHKSINTETSNSFWTWKYLGETLIKKGENEVEIFKPKQTSAAFIMDKMGLFDKKINVDEINE